MSSIDINSLTVTRANIAFDDNYQEVAANTARTRTVCDAGKVEFVKDGSGVGRTTLAIDGNKVLSSNGVTLYSHTLADWGDGSSPTYTTISSNIPTAFSALTVLSSGVYLAATQAISAFGVSYVYKSTDSGASWTLKHTFTEGFHPKWSPISRVGDSIVLCEYGDSGDTTGADKKKVYVSRDLGETWATAYSPTQNERRHTHNVLFKDGDEDTIYVFYGDSNLPAGAKTADSSGIVKLTWNGSTWDSVFIQQYEANPTSTFADGDYIYYGKDGGWDSAIRRINTLDDSVEDVARWPIYQSSLTSPQRWSSSNVNSFGLTKHDGIFYCSFNGFSGSKQGGLACSIDGVNWSWVYREEPAANAGPSLLTGAMGGYIWGTHIDGSTSRVFRLSIPTISNKTAIWADKAMTNELSASHSTFTTTSATTTNDATGSLVTASDEGITDRFGSGSGKVYKIQGAVGGSKFIEHKGDRAGSNATAGQYVRLKISIRAKSDYVKLFTMRVGWESSGTGLGSIVYAYVAPTTDWQDVELWAKATGTITAAPRFHIITSAIGQNASGSDKYTMDDAEWNNLEIYMDAVSISYHDTDQSAGLWQVGGTIKSDEKATLAISNLGAEFTTIFSWRPEMSSFLIQAADLYIGHITDGTNDIDIYWDESAGVFIATDGTSTATSSAITWLTTDVLKFAITNMSGGFRLSVCAILNSFTDHADSAATVLTTPTALVLGADSTNAKFSHGLFYNIQTFDKTLTTSEIEDIFENESSVLSTSCSASYNSISGGGYNHNS